MSNRHSSRLRVVAPSFLTLVALGVVAPACSDDDKGKAAANGGTPLVVETFNIGLAGSFVPNEEARRKPVIDSFAAAPADIVCVQEAWFQSDKDAITQAAKPKLPYAVSFKHDFNTAITDATDDSGKVPALPTNPPCAGEQLPKLDGALKCLADNCSTGAPGSDQGKATSSACPAEKCVTSAGAFVAGDDNDKRCYSCLAPNLPTETFANIKNICTTNPRADLAFGGQSGVMILSKYPLSNSRDIVLPGTWNRRVIATATATLPSGLAIDVWCNHLTPVFSGFQYPYTGQYSGGQQGGAAWTNEQVLQAKKLIAQVEKGPSPRAIILGDFNAGRGGAAPNGALEPQGVATLDRLEASFTPGVVAGFAPLCTFCKDNPNVGGDENTFIDHIFLKGIPQSAVTATERVYTEASVTTPSGAKVPLSDHYGLRSTLTLPAP